MDTGMEVFRQSHPWIYRLVWAGPSWVVRRLLKWVLGPLWNSPTVQLAVAAMSAAVVALWSRFAELPLGPKVFVVISGIMLLLAVVSAVWRLTREDVEEWIGWENDTLPIRNATAVFWGFIRDVTDSPDSIDGWIRDAQWPPGIPASSQEDKLWMWSARHEREMTRDGSVELLSFARRLYPPFGSDPHDAIDLDQDFEEGRRTLLIYFEGAAKRAKKVGRFRKFLDKRIRHTYRRTLLVLVYLDIALAGHQEQGAMEVSAADSALYELGKEWWEN